MLNKECVVLEKRSQRKKKKRKKNTNKVTKYTCRKNKIDCTKAKNVLKFGSPSLSGVLADVSNIPKNTLKW